MAKIRDDFEGITIVRTGASQDVILKAGDKVPKGVTVGDHLLAPKGAEPAQKQQEPADDQTGDTGTDDQGAGDEGAQTSLTVPPKAGAGSGTDVWRAYAVDAAKAKGLNVEIPEDATRADIIEALESANIPTE